MSQIPNKVLVTGGCGFLGSNISASFLKQGSEVVVIDALFRKGGEENLAWLRSLATHAKQFTHHLFDLADSDAVQNVMLASGPFDYICHLGGQVAMTTSIDDPRRDLMTNVVGTFNVLEAARKHSPDAFIAFSSTNKVYGDLERFNYREGETRYSVPEFPKGFDESLPLDFASPYGCSKGSADQYIHDWSRTFGMRTVVFRHSSIYGGRQYSTFDQGWIGWFCSQALHQSASRKKGNPPEPFTIAGNGKQVRDVLHADDLIQLYTLAYENKDRINGEVFNIGGGIENSLSLLELFTLLEKMTGQEPLVFRHLPVRQSDQKFFVAEISKAEQLLSWKPGVSASNGLSRMLSWLTEGH
jgi:CDP-paratose 2-epimerase